MQPSPQKEYNEESILTLFYSQNEITTLDVMNKFSISRATAQRWISSLTKKKLIETVGRTRNLRYRRLTKI